MKNLFAIDPIQPEVDFEKKNLRSRELYSSELKKGVELGRKLGKLQKNVAIARNYVTEICHLNIVGNGIKPDSQFIKAMRNTVRAMKGKNLL